jgi:hypothetical protein
LLPEDASHVRPIRARAAIAAIVAVGALLAAILLGNTTGHPARMVAPSASPRPSATPSPKPTRKPGPETPKFHFEVAEVHHVLVRKGLPAKTIARRVVPTVHALRVLFNRLYARGFLIRSIWRRGRGFGPVFEPFTGSTRPRARRDLETLTVGRRARRRFFEIVPLGGRLGIRVLLDAKGKPVLAGVDAAFSAFGRRRGGRGSVLVSHGQYLLRNTSHGWRITGYQVERGDHPAGAHHRKRHHGCPRPKHPNKKHSKHRGKRGRRHCAHERHGGR